MSKRPKRERTETPQTQGYALEPLDRSWRARELAGLPIPEACDDDDPPDAA